MNNTGQIIKSKKHRDFAVIPNSILQSSTLSLEEKGLLVYLLSLPEDWVLYKSNLHEKIGEKEGTVDRVFKLLQDRGYILSVKMIGEKGRFQGWNHIVYEEPTIEELEKNPYREQVSPTPTNPDLGQSAPIQIHSSNKDIDNTKLSENFSEAAAGFARWFDDKYFLENQKGVKKNLVAWAKEYEALVKAGYAKNDIWHAVEWAKNDPFWSANFFSPLKLRAKNKEGVKYIDVFLSRYNQEQGSKTKEAPSRPINPNNKW